MCYDELHCFLSGQGTISLEFLEQVPLLDTIIAPISGLFDNILVSIHIWGPISLLVSVIVFLEAK